MEQRSFKVSRRKILHTLAAGVTFLVARPLWAQLNKQLMSTGSRIPWKRSRSENGSGVSCRPISTGPISG